MTEVRKAIGVIDRCGDVESIIHLFTLRNSAFLCVSAVNAPGKVYRRDAEERRVTQRKFLVPSLYQGHGFSARARVGAEAAEHRRCYRLRIGFSHTAQCHARVFGFDHDHYTERLEALE